MPIPKSVLNVPRPINTVVIVYEKNKDKYAVRQRIGCRYDKATQRSLPVNGPTVGLIIDGVYVPLPESEKSSVSTSSVDLKDWANYRLCENVFHDIMDELRRVYSEKDSNRLYCIAVLRVCNPGITNGELKDAYDNGFLSEFCPGVGLSKNSVSKFLNDLGKT